jgi:hypothetical protein
VQAAASEIVLYSSEASVVRGNWVADMSSGAAGGRSMRSEDRGFSSPDAASASPSNFFEMTFDAPSATTYRVWLRLRAANRSTSNDSVWVQFSDATNTTGRAAYRIGTTSGMLVNMARCLDCGPSDWGWQNTAYWLSQETHLRFASAGKHTIRVQTREDGVEVDQIVLSASNYLSKAPGPIVNDKTILSRNATAATQSPFKGSAFSVPGTIDAADFDDGGAGVAYSDVTPGNQGRAYRSTDVDVQRSAGGGYNIGWTRAGEWVQYTVNVAKAGTYNLQLRVASARTASIQLTSGDATANVSVPNTGGWQSWRVVSAPLALAAGRQVLTVKFSTGGSNLRSITVAARASAPAPSRPATQPRPERRQNRRSHHNRRLSGRPPVMAVRSA